MSVPSLAAVNAPEFHNGSDGRAFVLSSDGTTLTELPVTKWDMTLDGKNVAMHNNRDGRYRQPGNPDASGSLTMHWDGGNPFVNSGSDPTKPNIRQSSILQLQLNPDKTVTAANSWRLTAIVDTVKPSSEFEGSIDYDVTWSLQSGAIKAPGDA